MNSPYSSMRIPPTYAAGASAFSGQFELVSKVLEAAIRKVTLTVSWKIGSKTHELVVVCYFTDPKAVDTATSGIPTEIPGGGGGGQ